MKKKKHVEYTILLINREYGYVKVFCQEENCTSRTFYENNSIKKKKGKQNISDVNGCI